jgi:hypothetical protein
MNPALLQISGEEGFLMEELECPKHDGTSTEHSLIEA